MRELMWFINQYLPGQVVTRKMESVSVRIMLRAKGATAASLDIFTLILIMSLAARRAFVMGLHHSASWLPDTPKVSIALSHINVFQLFC